jgi:sulfur-oxidizing protein SoxY
MVDVGSIAQEETKMSGTPTASTRRDFMMLSAALVMLPLPVLATPQQVSDEIKKLYGDKKVVEGKIKLDLPSIAENGLVVPLGFEVESPMTEKDHVKAVHLFAEGNPLPQVASFYFTAMAPKAAASIRLRLAQSQNIVAVAEMASGELYTVRREVKVTIGGCGG